jgi:SAM-dependent methyltransferase
VDELKPDGGYARWMRRTMRPFPSDAMLRHAVGGDFEAMGAIQMATLRHFGLQPDARVVDVGCGVGRLAVPLSGFLTGDYLGTDTNAAFLRAARRAVKAPNFRFERVTRLAIPAPAGSVDVVCFFSVFTHLLHEHTYLYLEEAKRVLAPHGRIVFSFLELASPAQWEIFAATVHHARNDIPRTLNVFVERPAIATWAERLELTVVDVRDGGEPFVPLAQPIRYDAGNVATDRAAFGQSVAVLAR